MTKKITFTIDGQQLNAENGETIMEAADRAGVYIPRLCDTEGLTPQGSCRVCTVKLNGRAVAACTQPVEEGAIVEHDSEELQECRRDLVRMLFQEGNHMCPMCEASGNCELQATAYRLGITQNAKYPYLQPVRPLDASHPDLVIDSNRCILCARCIRASKDVDQKHVFEYVGRGIHKKIGVNADKLSQTTASAEDLAFIVGTCPVGCIIQKNVGFSTPIGQRDYDQEPIGSKIDRKANKRDDI